MARTIKGAFQEISKSLKQYNSKNYISVIADLSSEDWNTVGTHELLTVTGLVNLTIIPEVTVTGDDTTGDTATISLGHESDTDNFIADTKVDTLASGEIWNDATPTEVAVSKSSRIDKDVNGVDIGIEVKGEAPTVGTIVFHCWWEPLNATGNVVAASGASLT